MKPDHARYPTLSPSNRRSPWRIHVLLLSISLCLNACVSWYKGNTATAEELLAAAGFQPYYPQDGREEANLKTIPQGGNSCGSTGLSNRRICGRMMTNAIASSSAVKRSTASSNNSP